VRAVHFLIERKIRLKKEKTCFNHNDSIVLAVNSELVLLLPSMIVLGIQRDISVFNRGGYTESEFCK
jgi:hypothetical protein